MGKEESFGNLLRRFFSNVDNFEETGMSSSRIYNGNDLKEVRALLNEVVKILGVKLYTPLFFEDELKLLKHRINSIQNQTEVDSVVEVIEDLLPHCQNFVPIHFSLREVIPGIRGEIKNLFKAN